MDIALARLDKEARHGKGDMDHSNKCCYMNNGRHHVGQTLQMADRTLLGEALAGGEVAVVVDMVVAIGTIGSGRIPLLRRVVVEGDGQQHGQIDHHEQPGKPRSSIVVITHFSNCKITNSHFYHQTMKYHLTKIVVSF